MISSAKRNECKIWRYKDEDKKCDWGPKDKHKERRKSFASKKIYQKNIKTLFAFKTMLLRVLASMVFLGVKENHLSISLSAVSGLFLGS